MKNLHNHLVNKIPTNDINVYNVSLMNKLMANSNSKYRLRIRYRGPINGKYLSGGVVHKENSSWFSLYLREV